MLKRLFTGLGGLALCVTLAGVIASNFTLVAVGAGTPPPGCFTDMGGLVVCGPNYQPSISPSQLPSAAPIPNNDVIGNIAGTSAPPTPVSVSALFDSTFSGAQGSLLYRNSTAWVALPPGTSGQILETLGAAANPAWTSAPVASAIPSASPPIDYNSGGNYYSIALGPCFTVSAGALQLNQTAANCSPTNSSYDTLMASEAAHYYSGAASNCLADTGTVGGDPLTTPTPGSTPGPYPSCGSSPITIDRQPSIQFPNLSSVSNSGTVGQAYLIVAAAALPTSGPYTISWFENGTAPFYGSGNLAAIDFTIDGTDTGNLQSTIENLLQNSGTYGHKLFYGGSGSQGNLDLIATGVGLYVAIVEDGTHLTMYENCDLVVQKSQTSGVFNQGNPGAWGGSQNPSVGDTFGGKMSKLAIRNSAVSQSTLCTENSLLH